MLCEQLGVQIHCLRHRIAEHGLTSALEDVARLSLSAVELVSFPGCRGNRWGDFGASADVPPPRIANMMAAAGLRCPSIMVSEAELANNRLGATLSWIGELGCRRVVLTALQPGPESQAARDWGRRFDDAFHYAQRCRARGFEFILHTQPELWAPV